MYGECDTLFIQRYSYSFWQSVFGAIRRISSVYPGKKSVSNFQEDARINLQNAVDLRHFVQEAEGKCFKS